MPKTILIIFLLIMCNSCENQSQESNTKTEITEPQAIDIVSDTIIADDYPITDFMLVDTINNHKVVSGNLLSMEKSWFTNNSLQQVIAVSLATDYYRECLSHFYTTDYLKLIKHLNLGLQTINREIPVQAEIDSGFNGFIQQAKQISRSYFTTNKGISLGDSLNKVLSIYGEPDSVYTFDHITRYNWNYNGDQTGLFDSTISFNKPVAKNSFGHGVVMFFQHNVLIAQILFNDIP